jgi:HlyD family secretion protein
MKSVLRKIGWLVVGGIVLAFLAYAFRPLPVEVDTATVMRGPLLVTVNAEGKTRIRERYVVSSPLAGQLLRIRHRPGDPVAVGETVLAVIEPSDPGLLDARAKGEIEAKVKATQAAKQQADAGLNRAKSAHQLALAQYQRVKDLRDRGIASAEEYDVVVARERVAADEIRASEFAVRVAEFEHEQAKAARIRIQPRVSAETELDRFEIRSPVGGLILRVFQESEAVVPTGAKLLELGDLRDLEMEIDVLSTDAVKIRPGAQVIVDHWGGPEPLVGRVRVVEPSGFLKVSALGVEEQRVNVIADFTDPLEKRRPLGDAYRVEARIVISDSDALKVAAGALFRRGTQWSCFVVRDRRSRLQAVTVGRTNGLETEIIDGLTEGDIVIVHPGDRVEDNARVKFR